MLKPHMKSAMSQRCEIVAGPFSQSWTSSKAVCMANVFSNGTLSCSIGSILFVYDHFDHLSCSENYTLQLRI